MKTIKLVQYKLNTDLIGPLYLVASDKGLRGIYWSRQKSEMLNDLVPAGEAGAMLSRAVTQLREYFAGKRKVFDVPLDVLGTEFQRKVWGELSRIPYGSTCSYTDIARRIRNAKAVRAVGTANGRNPLSIVIPCHRVVSANGTLGGYAGGLETKQKLLRLEGAWGAHS